jgi:hypothetical protein
VQAHDLVAAGTQEAGVHETPHETLAVKGNMCDSFITEEYHVGCVSDMSALSACT